MKKILKNIIIGSLLLTPLVACEQEDTSKHVAIFAYNENDVFIHELVDSLSLNLSFDYKVDVFYGENSQTTQNKQIEKALSSIKYDAFIVNLVDRMAASTIVRKTEYYNLPLVFFNREPLYKDIKDSKFAYYVGTNGKDEGREQGRLVKNLFHSKKENIKNSKYDLDLDGKLSTLILRGETGHQDTEDRTSAVIEELNDFNIKYIGVEACDWSREKGFYAVQKAVEDGKTIELIISNNDSMAFGAIDYYTKIKEKALQMPIIIGVDGTKEGIDMVDKGFMYGTIINDIVYQTTIIKEITNDLVKKGTSAHPKTTYAPTRIYKL